MCGAARVFLCPILTPKKLLPTALDMLVFYHRHTLHAYTLPVKCLNSLLRRHRHMAPSSVVALLGKPVVDVAALDVAALGGGDVRLLPLGLLALVGGLLALGVDVALLVRLVRGRGGARGRGRGKGRGSG